MAVKYVYNPQGELVRVDDGQPDAHGTSGDPGDPQGLVMGQPHKPANGKIYGPPSSNTNPGGLSNYKANLETARMLWGDADNKNHTTAAVIDPYTLNREAELNTRAQQMAVMDRYKRAGMGYGPSVAPSMARAGADAALRAQMGAGKNWRAGLAGGAAAHGGNALGAAGMAGNEQQNAWKATVGAAFGSRSADMAAASEQAKMDQALSLGNATYAQQAGIANMGADLNRLSNRVNAANAFGGIVADNRSADTSTFGFDKERERRRLDADQAHQDNSDAKTAAYLNTIAKLFTYGAA